jgi:hypothetical protein
VQIGNRVWLGRCGSWRGHSCNQGCSSRAYLCGEPRQAAHANCL